ncbi:plasmid replication protein RepC [Lichenibacterium dinghuense]|uniref:plasmid replication protein RepC n=1 Tax=Lichenibacterium dinghuense TaxID=2895977 RepID=UPI001F2E7F81|nr:plasmid replication protein RepC [Lichenibacterium sp. 6Y81]
MGHITTPFGRRTLSLGMAAAQVAVRDLEGKVAHKWKVFRSITECKELVGVSDRALVVLNALLTCLPETALAAGDLVVFPSNKALSLRSHGMAETTLRRHLASLVDAGLLIRRDSPNGKRYAHRGEGGIELAYGFDLSPLLARAEEFSRLAAEVEAAKRSAAMARERVTIYRRDIGKMIEAGAAAGADWRPYREAFAGLCQRLPRKVTVESVAPLVDSLHALAMEVSSALECLVSNQKLGGNATQDGAQIENSNTDPITELEPAYQKEQGGGTAPRRLPLELVLRACPDIAMYGREGVGDWRDLLTAAGLVRGMLGISPSAWQAARETMGDEVASVAVAAILQRTDAIRSPGGYLRALTEKSRAGTFSAWPVLLALVRSGGPTEAGSTALVPVARPGPRALRQ